MSLNRNYDFLTRGWLVSQGLRNFQKVMRIVEERSF